MENSMGTSDNKIDQRERRQVGQCYDCGGLLELAELDIKKGTRIMKCQECSLFHYYKKDLLGRWTLLKVSKYTDR